MGMSFVSSVCDKCGARQNVSSNMWGYGSPIVICKSCGAEYLERQLREPAIDGTVSVTTNTSSQLKGLLICLAMTAVGGLCYKFFTYGRLKMLAIAMFGVLGMIYFGALLIKNKSGAADKENQRYLEESEHRLSDRNYAEKLRALGYKVPDRFLK